MKLQELWGIKSRMSDQPGIAYVEATLLRHGFQRLGDGAHASVWQVPKKPYVLKLFLSSDQAYLGFVKLAKQNPNPHFPKFRGSPIPLTSQVHAIRMERLKPLPNTPASALNRGIRVLMELMQDHNRLWQSIQAGNYLTEQSKRDLAIVLKKWPSLERAADILTEHLFTKLGDVWLDLHDENVMIRSPSVPVFTDPFAH
jgi:hypothetical protein